MTYHPDVTYRPDIAPTPIVFADAVWTPRPSQTLLRDVALVLAGSAFIALSAQIAVPLPFSPVPVTGQTFGVLLTGVLLGGRRGALASIAYLAEGAAGLPIFAGGLGGILPFLGATGGYLAAFPIAAFVTGTLAERDADKRAWTAGLVMLLGSLIILTLGALRLSALFGDLPTGLAKGFAPFVFGEVGKATGAAMLLPVLWRTIRGSSSRR